MQKSIQIAYNDYFEIKCKLAHEAGFAHMAVNFTEVKDKTEYEWQVLTDDIARVLEQYKLQCVQSHPFYYPLLISSEIIEEKHEFAIEQAIIASGKLGASWCALHPRTSITTGRFTSGSFADNQKMFAKYLECAVKHNTGIAAENLPVFADVKPAVPFYSCNYEDLCNLVDSFGDPAMGICWDTGHAHMMRYDQAEAIRFLGERIRCTHIHNNDTTVDNHFAPDNGTIQWEHVMKAFRDIDYRGPFTLETQCYYLDEYGLRNYFDHNFRCLLRLEELLECGEEK